MSRMKALAVARPDLRSKYAGFGTMTDREYFRGQGTLLDQFTGEEHILEAHIKQAKKDGYTPGINDVYNPMIANKPGDGKAFVPPTGGRGHIKRVCQERNQAI